MNCTTCENCVKFKCLVLPQCPDFESGDTFTLEVGTLEPDTDYGVVFQNDANGNVFTVAATSDGAGLLTVELDSVVPYLTDKAPFTLWMMLASGQMYDYQPFTYSGGDPDEPTTCGAIRFDKAFDAATGFPFNIENQKLYV